MANQPQTLLIPAPRTYTRAEFAALRAWVQRVPSATIARLYFDADIHPWAGEHDALERHLRQMRDELVRLAILNGSPVLADHLRSSIRQHGSAHLSAVTLRMVEDASRLAVATPAATHAAGLWFRPLIATRLAQEGIHTLGELVAFCNSLRRQLVAGGTAYRPVACAHDRRLAAPARRVAWRHD